MSSIANTEGLIMAYFNGTPLNFPFVVSVEEAFKKLDMMVVNRDDEDVEDIYNQMVEIENQLNTDAKRGFVTPKTIKKTAQEFGIGTGEMLALIWCGNIQYLLKKGRIVSNNDYGFLIMRGDNVIQNYSDMADNQYALSALCPVCKVKSKLRCSKCKVVYCCREHQVQDWKNHKKTCVL